MWTRKELKEKALPAFKANYWVSVVAALVIGLFAAAGGSSSRHSSSNGTDGSAIGMAGLYVLAILIAALVAVSVVIVVKILIGNALIVGAQKVFINNETTPDDAQIGKIVFVFSNGYWGNVTLTMFLKDLFTGLWTLLFVIPGIIKSYEYRMIPYLLADNPEMTHQEAFAKSKEMMNGQKWNAFVLDLSFIGWFILTVLTLGILGVFYVYPYFYQTSAELYLTLKENA